MRFFIHLFGLNNDLKNMKFIKLYFANTIIYDIRPIYVLDPNILSIFTEFFFGFYIV
jgi:hypothetical protein